MDGYTVVTAAGCVGRSGDTPTVGRCSARSGSRLRVNATTGGATLFVGGLTGTCLQDLGGACRWLGSSRMFGKISVGERASRALVRRVRGRSCDESLSSARTCREGASDAVIMVNVIIARSLRVWRIRPYRYNERAASCGASMPACHLCGFDAYADQAIGRMDLEPVDLRKRGGAHASPAASAGTSAARGFRATTGVKELPGSAGRVSKGVFAGGGFPCRYRDSRAVKVAL